MLAIGGLRYVMSHGDQTQMEEAKKTITYAIIGLIVIVLSYAIVSNIIRLSIQTAPTGAEMIYDDDDDDNDDESPAAESESKENGDKSPE
jgi:hypothetical protein